MSLKGRKQTFKVARGEDGETNLEEYEITLDEGMVVLDCMHRIQHEQEPDMAVRWNCKAGKCGSCSAEINGRPRLMCMTRMSDVVAETPKGKLLTLTAALVCIPASPNIETIKSDAPFITLGCSVKSSVEFTNPVSLIHDFIFDKSSPHAFLA